MNRRGKRRKEVNSHISLHTIKQYLQFGKYPNGCPPTDKRGIRKRCESFKLEGDDLYYIARPRRLDDEPVDPNPENDRNNYRKAVLTVREQLAVTARAHVSESGVHKGTERTLHGVSSQYYWVGMSATARQIVKSCALCLTRQETSCYETTKSTKTVSAASSNSQKPSTESKEGQIESNAKEDMSIRPDGNELPITVTAEVENSVEEDPGLDFEVGSIFSDGRNLMEECEILKAQRFWERVEILIFCPTENSRKEDGRGRHKNYTIVALDSFSKWPEIKKLDKINEQTISQFIIQLISRFGIMNQLVVLENDLLMEQSVVTSGITQNLSMFNVIVMLETYNPYDDNWARISKCVSQFVQSYPSSWSSCLDLCLMPLRNSVPLKSDYTPAFVVTGREPVFPTFLFPHRDSSSKTEKMLNQEQIEIATYGLMSNYLECCEADVKLVIAPLDSIPVKITNPLRFIKEESLGVRKSGRKVTLSQRLADYDHVLPSMSGQTEEDMDADIGEADSNDAENGDDMTQSVPLKKRKHAGFASGLKEMIPLSDTNDHSNEFMPRTDTVNPKKCDAEDVLNKLDSCTFYQVLKLYVEKGEYPLNSPVTFKRVIRKAREMYSMEDEKLMYNHKNKTKKTVLMTMKERLQVLDEIHTSSDNHVPRSRMLDLIEQRKIYWKNFGGDVDAYVKACPNCKHGKARTRVKKKPGKNWQADKNSEDEEDWSVGQKYQDRVSSFYPDLIEFLESGIGPSHLSRSELVIFKKKAKNFKLVKGELFYSPSSTATKIKGRKVIANEDLRSEVMRKAHGDSHQPPSVMLTEIKKLYYWRSMWSDMENFVESCCQSEMETNKDKTDDLNQKVELFARHFKGEDISNAEIDLDSLFPEMYVVSTDVANNESLDHRTGQLMWNIQQKQEIVSDDVVSKSSDAATDMAGLLPDQQMATAMSTSDDTNKLSTPVTIVESALDGSSITTTISDVAPSVLHYSVAPASSTVDLDNQKVENEEVRKGQEFQVELVEDGKLSQLEHGMDDEEEEGEEGEGYEKGDALTFLENLKNKNTRLEKIRCEICRKIVRGENNLKEHMYKHNGIKPFSCEVCNKKLTTVKGMRMHMRKHNGHRPYLCNICGRGFPRSASLRYHIQTHSKGAVIPVKCDICDRSFTSEHKLQKHKRFKHPEKRPVWKCDVCGKHFTAKRSLKRHEEAHQGIRRYVCEFCNRSFFRKEYLTYHLDSHYKGNPAMAHLASKRKRRLTNRQQSLKEDNANLLSIYTVEPDMGPGKMYTQLVEVTNPEAWSEDTTEVPTVFTLEGGTLQVSEGRTLRVSEGGTLQVTEGGTLQVTEGGTLQVVDQADPGTALVMVEEGGATTANVVNHNQEMEISHIIMSADISSQENTAEPNQLHVSLPTVHQSVQQTQNELTITTTSSTVATPTHIDNVETIVDDNVIHSQIEQTDHNVVQEVTTQVKQEVLTEHDEHHQELQVEQQQQPGTILATITAPSTSSSDGSIIIPTEGSGSRQIEVRMSNGQKLTLSRTDDSAGSGKEGGQGEQMVQYRLECLDGETITEEHLNAFRMLAQASSLLQP